jgi:photosystem II stability/assembly factor-like uncharacterized protein
MKNSRQSFVVLLVITVISFFTFSLYVDEVKKNTFDRVLSSSSPKAEIKMKKGRWEYFNRMLQDPVTKQIPKGIRQKELEFANNLEEKNKSLNKTSLVTELSWQEGGPADVGGRTRALAVDITNANTIIAGGASGGIWKSTDNGNTWTLKSSLTTILSVTSIAQDPSSGNNNNWYYSTGEWSSNLAGTQATSFTGDGIYKSTDSGESWNLLSSTVSSNITGWESPFDYVNKIEISPSTGSIFIATQGFGIFRSNDEGNSFAPILGTEAGEHFNSDISVANDGTIVVAISSPFQGFTPQNSPGVYKSTDNGNNWTNITPQTFPQNHFRNIVEIAPSNTDVAYVVSYTGEMINQTYEDVKFHKINIANGASEDRSANLPVFTSPFGGEERVNTQNGYNITLVVKPDDENFVLIGTTSLFRSTNGFATIPDNSKLDWIGGYHTTLFGYPNFHPDIHSFSFDPTNPKAMWWGHDGGLSYTSDITNSNYSEVFPWEKKNNGYNVTQFYHISISSNSGDNRIMGGTQDNGTPYFVFSGAIENQIDDVSSGDGSFSYFGNDFAYTSSQNGNVTRLGYDNQNNPSFNSGWSDITPPDASNQYFINPFVVDPNDENIMYYPAGNVIWRNNQLGNIQNFQNGTSEGWTKLDNITVPSGYGVFALEVSTTPAHILYYSGSSLEGGTPKIYKLSNSNSATNGAIDISIPNAPAGSYVKEISINPDNGNEIFVVLSNYNIIGLYHSLDGGQTYTAVEGNLEGTEQSPGPSLRSATFLPSGNETNYFVGTSIGVFSTTELNGTNTLWSQEGQNVMGNVIVSSLTSRKSDGRIVAGTHGRGAFVANINTGGGGTAIASVNENSLTLQSNPGETGTTSFLLSNDGDATLNYSISVSGNFNSKIPKTAKSKYYIHKTDKSAIEIAENKNKLRHNNFISDKIGTAKQKGITSNFFPNEINGSDVLTLDDGDMGADDFFGYSDGSDLFWFNEFDVSGFDFELDAFQFYMKTDQAISNLIDAGIYDQLGNLLSYGELSLDLAPSGSWFEIPLHSPLSFKDGETFAIELQSKSFISFVAGVDTDAMIKNKSYYFNWGTSVYDNLNTISGFENGAFLIRAVGTKSGGGNQNPVAVANVSKTQAEVYESITFDASQSYDNDGQIVNYSWNFGDGKNSDQASVTHSFTQANTYTYTLVVTDNQGAIGQTSGQLIISDPSNQFVTVEPSSGIIPPGGNQNIVITLNAQSLQEGSYTGQVIITTNGGNITLPIDYLVDVEKLEGISLEYNLSQNYPNPFNPSTSIEFSIPNTSNVSLTIYDMLGKEVLKLLDEKKYMGTYKVNFNAANLASGIYVYRLETNEFSDSKKLILLK